MKLLAWDTSSKTGAIAALEAEGGAPPRIVSEWSLGVEATHSERLLWGIHQVLEASRWSLEDVDVLGVGVGPGSFTGLRIGVSTARTLAQLLKKPLVGVSSLAALARPHAQALAELEQKTLLIVATDACKGELFSLVGVPASVKDCVCKAEGDLPGVWKRGVEETHGSAEALVASVQKRLKILGPKWSWMVLGEGRALYPEVWKKLPRAREKKPFFPQSVQGRSVAWLAWEAVQAGVTAQANQIYPRYLRESDAERKLKAGLLPPAPRRSGSA